MESIIGVLRARRAPLLVGVIGVVFFGIAYGLWEWAGSNEFCGELCHVNFSSYESARESPHDRVKCVECHLGRGLLAEEFARKSTYLGHPLTYLLRRYERPVFASSLRPARETCEQCHWPLAFHDDSVWEIRRFAQDEENTQSITYLVMRTGGGTAREGRGKGIHWHVENQVWYVATDPLRQDIPLVRMIDQQGNVTEYLDVTNNMDPQVLAEESFRLMDCIDCHNRKAHLFRSPEKAIDNALALNQISRDIPFIKARGVSVLSVDYDSVEAGLEGIAGLEDFYRTSYGDFYSGNRDEVETAIEVLQEIYVTTSFPDLEVTWSTHPDNDGHDEFAGCFRCHDGKHISEQGESIRLHCNICHSIPVTIGPDDRPPAMPIAAIPEPPDHLATDWMDRHRFVANGNCEDCHGPHTFGSDDSNFCSNGSCHGRAWEWVGLDAAFEHPVALPGRHADLTCNLCHEQATKPENDCAVCHEDHPHDWGAQDCELCHSPLGWIESTTGALGAPTPHALEGREECLVCHAPDTSLALPDDHQGRGKELCGACHPFEESS